MENNNIENRLEKIELAIAALFKGNNLSPQVFNYDFGENIEGKKIYEEKLQQIRKIIFEE